MTRASQPRIAMLATIAIAGTLAFACGGDGASDPTPAAATAAAPAGTPPPEAQTAIAEVADIKQLAALVLTAADVPDGFAIASNLPLAREDVARALAGIQKTADFVAASTLNGAWVAFYRNASPPSAMSSIVFRFETAADARLLVSTVAGLTLADDPGAKILERVPSAKIEDAAQLMRYGLPGSRTLEYTWAQGRLAGQVILTYGAEIERPDDAALMAVLAQKQAARMRTYPQ